MMPGRMTSQNYRPAALGLTAGRHTYLLERAPLDTSRRCVIRGLPLGAVRPQPPGIASIEAMIA